MKLKALFIIALATLTLTSCTKSEDFSSFLEDDTVTQIEVGLVYRPASLRNQAVDFALFDEDGTDISAGATFYVDGTALEESTFSSDVEGTFEVYAEFDNNGTTATTETETFSVVVPKRKVSIEDHTGTWCGYCPRVTEAIEKVHDITDNITVVAIHNNDEMTVAFEELLRQEFEVFGFPTGRLNRTSNWSPPYEATDVTSMAGEDSAMGIGISSSINGSTLNATISVSSEEGLTGNKLVVYLVEDGIIADQVNYLNNDPNSQYYQQGDPIVGFVHDDVLRASLTDIFGNNITSTPALEEYKTTLSTQLSPEYVVENLELVVMVTDTDNATINSQYAKVNETKGYE
ncbi:Omp28-related outer membrane protein [Marinirhabdus gelatinilytica]|uniref:Outer membrane protein Omp28 n=1 Tax=Marinirhabdus gelatinilytica TaxID=1703343 RepID=A0A370Q743_9FLAO|nr:Omp28-related outer membrane protein [Marinirhabdus gelatinilytica]RDK84176.1 outer membrane protein Omp28 [Marinirhabdus gelatinilytica]